MQIFSAKIYKYKIAFKKPLGIMGKTHKFRRGFIIELTDTDGNKGYGETAPLPGLHKESLDKAEPELYGLLELAPGETIDNEQDILDYFPDLKMSRSVRYGIQTALFDLFTKNKGCSFAEAFSENPDKKVNVNALVTGTDNIAEAAAGLIEAGYSTIKIKVGKNIPNEIKEIEKLSRMIEGTNIKLRLDANRGISFKTARNLCACIPPENLEYLEEPIADCSKLEKFHEKTGLPVALDETIYHNEGYLTIDIRPGTKAVVLKPSLIGSYSSILELCRIAGLDNVNIVLSSTFESSIGLRAIINLAAGLNLYPTAIGIDTYKWFDSDSTTNIIDCFGPEIESDSENMQETIINNEVIEAEKIFENRNYLNAILSRDKKISYYIFTKQVLNAFGKFRGGGIGKGDRVAIILENCPEYPAILFALFKVGAVAVPVNTRFPENQIKELMDQISCNNIVTSPERFGVYQDYKLFDYHELFKPDIQIEENYFFEDLINEPEESQDATIIFTSGSSGRPKAVLHTFGNHYYSALGSNEHIEIGPGDRWLLSLPIYHVGGLAILYRAFISRASVVFPDEGTELIDEIINNGITHISLVSTQLYRLMESEQGIEVLRKCKAVLLGGSAFPKNLINRAIKNKIPVYLSYGSTEMGSQIYTSCKAEPEKGKALKYREMKIAETGEILVKGKTLFRAYISGNELIRPFDDEGWFSSGDSGYFDDLGNLHIRGRKDNMFISGGENIQPEEIEQALCSLEDIHSAVVVPVDNPEFGKRPLAFIETGSGQINENEIKLQLRQKIAGYKIPDRILSFPSEYQEKSIKADRKFLEEHACTALGK